MGTETLCKEAITEARPDSGTGSDQLPAVLALACALAGASPSPRIMRKKCPRPVRAPHLAPSLRRPAALLLQGDTLPTALGCCSGLVSAGLLLLFRGFSLLFFCWGGGVVLFGGRRVFLSQLPLSAHSRCQQVQALQPHGPGCESQSATS